MSDIERRIADFLHEEADEAPRPDAMNERVLHRAKVRRAVAAVSGGLTVVLVVTAGVVTAGSLRSPSTVDPAGIATPATSAPTSREVRGCSLTIPPQPPFVPPSPYPSRYPNPDVPGADDKQWYGTPALWTTLESEGEVWRDLPDEDGNGKFFEKTLWWSESHSPEEGLYPISVTGRRLDRPGSFETGGPGGGGFRHDVRSFMLVGVEMRPGCWEITATYRGTELSYVVLVED